MTKFYYHFRSASALRELLLRRDVSKKKSKSGKKKKNSDIHNKIILSMIIKRTQKNEEVLFRRICKNFAVNIYASIF